MVTNMVTKFLVQSTLHDICTCSINQTEPVQNFGGMSGAWHYLHEPQIRDASLWDSYQISWK